MPLRKQPASLTFAGGIETKIDPKQAPVTRLLDLQNATFVKASTLAKRNGYESLGLTIEGTAGTVVANAVGLGSRDDEVIIFDGSHAYSRRADNDQVSDTGEVACATMRDASIARTGTQQTMPTHATAGGLTAVAWEDNRGGVWYSLVDATTGRIVVPDTQLDANGQQPLCMPCGSRIHILWAVPASKAVNIVVIDSMNATAAPTPSVLIADLSSALPYYDACFATSSSPNYVGDGCAIAWVVDGSSQVKVGYVTVAGVLGAAVSGFPIVATVAAVATGPVAVAYDRAGDQFLGVAFPSGGQVICYLCFANNLSNQQGPGQIVAAPAAGTLNHITAEFAGDMSTTAGRFWAACDIAIGAIDTSTLYSGSVSNDVTTINAGDTRTIRGHVLASRAFLDNGNVSAAVAHPVKFFPYVAVIRLSGATFGAQTITEARILPGESTGARPRPILPTVIAVDGDDAGIGRQHAFAVGRRLQLSSSNGDQFGEAGIRIATLDYDDPDAYQCAQLGRGLYMAGALLQHYDGRRWAEAGFHAAPDTSAGGPAGNDIAAGGTIAAGTYGYRFSYEEVDNEGELHRGPVSVLVNVVVAGAGHSVSFNIPTCRLTGKKNVRIAVWRSKANDNSQFFRATSLDPSVVAGNNRFVANDPTTSTVAFVDGLDDATLGTKEPLYTNGGILSNDPTVCAGGAITSGKNRLFWTDPSDPNLVRYSQALDDDAAMEESASLKQSVDPYGGRIIALSILDDAVIVHKETATYRFVGPGPDADGGQTSTNAFSPAQLITSDVGCSSPRSVVQGPLGVMFRSSKGIGLLGRDGQIVMQVGDPVYAYKDQNIVRATLLPDRHQILFLTDATDGRTLLYDYEHQQWSTYTNHVGVDGVVVGGVYHYLRTDGRLFRETPGVYLDDNAHISMLVSTAWIKLSGYLQGFQKIITAQIIGAWKSSHTLRMRWRLDYEDGWRPPVDVAVDNDYAPSVYGSGSYGTGGYDGSTPLDTVYEQRYHINRRCQAIAFEFSDREAEGVFGAAFELSELLLIGGVLGPQYPIGAGRMQ